MGRIVSYWVLWARCRWIAEREQFSCTHPPNSRALRAALTTTHCHPDPEVKMRNSLYTPSREPAFFSWTLGPCQNVSFPPFILIHCLYFPIRTTCEWSLGLQVLSDCCDWLHMDLKSRAYTNIDLCVCFWKRVNKDTNRETGVTSPRASVTGCLRLSLTANPCAVPCWSFLSQFLDSIWSVNILVCVSKKQGLFKKK